MDNNTRARKVAIGSIVMVILTIGTYIAIPVYILPIMEAVNASIGQVVLLFTFAAITSLICSLLIGTILKKFKIKVIVPFAGACFAIFFIMVAYAKNISMIYVGSLFFGISTVLGGFGMAQTLITWWYAKGTAKMISYLSLGVGIGGLILPTVLANLLSAFGLQTVALGHGVIIGSLVILIGLFLLSDHPDAYGFKPIGWEDSTNQETNVQLSGSLNMKQILGTSSFWFIISAVVLVTISVTGFTNNASAYYQNKGLNAVQAALCISIYNGANLVWSPVYGILVDKYGHVKSTTIYGIIGAAIFFIANSLSGFAGCVVIAALISTLNMSGMLGPITLPRLFGGEEAANMIGFSNAAGSIGAMIGAPIAGFIFDTSGSYNTYMIVGGVMVLLTIIFTVIGASKKAIENIESRKKQLSM